MDKKATILQHERLVFPILAILLASLLFPGCVSPGSQAAAPKANLGVLDCGGFARSVVALDGQWSFWWGRFLDPSVLAGGARIPDPVYGAYPGQWASYGIPGASYLGYGTYRLRVTGLDSSADYALKLSSFQTSARIFVNGELVCLQGVPGSSSSTETPAWGSRVARARVASDGTLDLVIHISNFSDRLGGSRTSILLGPYEKVEEIRDGQRLLEIFLFGGILLMGLYYLALFVFRRKDQSTLWFGLLCLVVAVRILCYDEYILLDILPRLPWVWLFRIGYLTFSMALLLMSAFLRSLFPDVFWKTAHRVLLVGAGAYSLLILAAPPLWTAWGLTAFQLFALAGGATMTAALIRALIQREPGAPILASGFGCLFASVVHDILASQGVLAGPFLVQFGLLFFLFAMSLVVTRKFALAFEIAERLSESLARTNASLERFVPREFLRYLKKTSIDQISLGDHSEERMAILFSDIRSFSRFSEKMQPAETFRFLNAYLERIGPSVKGHGGFVDKYLGDGIMALFPESADSAVRCAIEMHRRIREYNEDRKRMGAEPIAAGMGIHTGLLMLGTIGDRERMDGTVISEAVNLASRLEGLTKEYGIGIAVSEQILASLKDPGAYRVRFLGKIGVKGKREPMTVYEIYDGDSEELKARKDGIRDIFEEAINAFYAQDYARANKGFRETLELMPEDEPSHYYMRMIRKLNLS